MSGAERARPESSMRKNFLHLAIPLAFCCTVAAQTAQNETARLRESLGLASDKKIVSAALDKLPVGSRPLRVFLAVGSEKKRRDYYARQIKQWNRYKMRQLASLELVQSLDRADIILARYELAEKPELSTSSIIVYEPFFDPLTRTTRSKPVKQTNSFLTVPVRVYVLRPAEERIEILRENYYMETRKTGEIEPIADMLWISLVELLSGP